VFLLVAFGKTDPRRLGLKLDANLIIFLRIKDWYRIFGMIQLTIFFGDSNSGESMAEAKGWINSGLKRKYKRKGTHILGKT